MEMISDNSETISFAFNSNSELSGENTNQLVYSSESFGKFNLESSNIIKNEKDNQ